MTTKPKANKDWFIATYDAVVAEHPDDGITLADAREEVALRYATAVLAGEIEPVNTEAAS